jgi:sugar O-acyltransferase (sialic acid O-acetyltransferase NeuD family)
MAQLVIFGASEIAELAHWYFTRDSEHEVVAFTVDRDYRKDDTFLGLPMLDFETITEHYPPEHYHLFVAVSYARMNQVRAAKYTQAKKWGYTLVSYVSSRCTFLSDHPVGENCFILEDNTIQPFVKIGNNVTLWSGNHVGHEAVIEDHCFIASHIVISGHVHIHPYCFIGVNATLHNNITIATATLIGAGAIIAKDTEEKGVYVPTPAKQIAKKSDEVHL